MSLPDGQLEWLATNELGSFALGDVDRKLRRKYHALLTVRDPGRGEPWNVLADVCEELVREDESALLADPLTGRGRHAELSAFSAYPHATHRYRALDVEVERQVRLGARDQVEIHYRVRRGRAPLRLMLEPLLRCRPLHALTQENPFLDGTCTRVGNDLHMLPYAGMPGIALRIEGHDWEFQEHGRWLSVQHYEWEAERGYPAQESLFSPGRFHVELQSDASFTLVVGLSQCCDAFAAKERSSDLNLMAKLERASSQFFMRDSHGRASVIAGFPWYGARSRDALIALPGMYLASMDWERSAAVLDHLLQTQVQGLLPSQLDATPAAPSVEATLLFARTVQWFGERLGQDRVARFMHPVCELLQALADGAHPRARLDQGLGIFLQPGATPLTWMDAVVGGSPVTPRFGHAVEIDALAYNAAHFACAWADAHRPQFARAFRTRLRHAEGAFVARYWDDLRGYLADTHDGHAPDASLRPNQLWALALPFRPVSAGTARAALSVVTRELLTPLGLRSLSARDPAYRGTSTGPQAERDRAMHQGSIYPSLLGLYTDAVIQTYGPAQLQERVGPALDRLGRHVDTEGCIGHISELFTGDPPHSAQGAPAHASSVAEVYRTVRTLHDDLPRARGKTHPAAETPP